MERTLEVRNPAIILEYRQHHTGSSGCLLLVSPADDECRRLRSELLLASRSEEAGRNPIPIHRQAARPRYWVWGKVGRKKQAGATGAKAESMGKIA